MNPARIAGANAELGAPQKWSAEEHGHCANLWVRREVEDGMPWMRSAWEATPNEVGLLLAGAKLELGILGQTHPVVNLGVGPLPDDFAPPMIVERTVHQGASAVRVSMFFANGRRVWAEAYLEPHGLGRAVKLAIDSVENRAKQDGLL
ncbi:hypothetical protein CA223_06740 [Sphingomonas koreensis]|uniref:Uncharacterized protein n=1 Tax=Sphingomonas koreensis TaxID=93064 RepID=A0A1L6J7Z6_9SPHN|nr:hypothetical protein [Sphingomonas koreensis]APR52004.1 hypothetical protein BRX40_05740 [Sphingomonas koreensis]RSU22808.1 hypothetical protein CA224_05360 [Sphingomonas koreensis]RSU30718.1 hypothetical protein CA222_01185 [Sphingomonas koreensis]RSU31813.1 hypothetical protein CA225_00265 [Sphingomonas koreensis]RSU39266.1 hypothetical protein BRX39_01265 [Sphingomonas koreensis]